MAWALSKVEAKEELQSIYDVSYEDNDITFIGTCKCGYYWGEMIEEAAEK